jgi:outer membrane murein-binding lipoprotein Lpp
LTKVLRKNTKKRKNKSLTENLVQYLVIGPILALVLLAGCSSNMCPDQTKIEVGVTETDAKNDKLQEKKLLTQTFKWGKKKCNDG